MLFIAAPTLLEISTRLFFVLGQGPVNPLLLLGQYSDDELDEDLGNGVNDATLENSSANLDDQGKVADGVENEDTRIKTGQDATEQVVEQENMESLSASVNAFLEENGIRENNAADSGDLHRETNTAEHISVLGASGTQTTEDVSSGWKMVLHEESNTYYYWNIVTGETSWVAPDVMSQGTESVLVQNTALETEEKQDAFADTLKSTQKSTSILDEGMGHAVGSQPILEEDEINDFVREGEVHKEVDIADMLDQKGKGNDVNASDAEMSSIPVAADHRTSLPGDLVASRQSDDALLGSENKGCADSGTQNMIEYEQQQTMSDLSSNLVRHGEYLLGRLKSLKGSNSHDYQIAKLMLEVEIRLHDMRSLESYGSSLLPFWLHSESQLKLLEAAIDDEVLKFCESAKIGESNAVCKSDEIIHDDVQANADADADADAKKALRSTPADSNALGFVGLSTEFGQHSCNNPAVHAANVPSEGYLYSFSDSDLRGIAVACVTGKPADPKPELQTDDDMDMDVEMEVEDAVAATNTVEGNALTAQYAALVEHPMPPQPPAEHESPLLEEGQIPPLPDDEWIPPPPPDDEPIPPPPPDEPPESVPPPPSEIQAVPRFSYADHYNLAYLGSGFEYYGQTNTEIPSSGYYVDANGCQVAAPLPQLYYTPVPDTYSAVALGVVNSVEPVAYYAIQDGTLSSAPVISGVETHGLQSTPDYVSLGSGQNGTVEAQIEVGFTPTEVDTSAVGKEIGDASLEAQFVPAPIQAPATKSMNQGVPMVSNPAVATTIALTEMVPKVQSKASRNKKRTVAVVSSLRSNKKVSGLVDKWKAAKEELHEAEEEEPENPYELLEKKRQREIEEWRAQQIATGEAKDNANFQPLGGDWRERVKRKRAKTMSEAAQTSPQALDNGNQQQPDIIELSRDLPSGWQAYWDELSKQVYYGNSVTSETTWIRPTN